MDSHMESGSSFDSNPIPLGYSNPYWWDEYNIEHLVLLIVFHSWCVAQKGRREIFYLNSWGLEKTSQGMENIFVYGLRTFLGYNGVGDSRKLIRICLIFGKTFGFVRIAEDFWGEGGCELGDSKCSLPSHAFQSEKHAHANTTIVIVTLIVIVIVFVLVINAHTISLLSFRQQLSFIYL